MDKLYQVKDRIIDEIEEYADKDKLSANDAMTLKALAGSADHLCNIIDKADEGHSSMYPYAYDDGVNGRSMRYSRNRSYRGSYAQRRDSMGRYSRDGLADKLRDLMADAPDERTRMEIQRLVEKMEA